MAAQNWDWVFHALGWTLAGLGLLLALWALFYDRSRGRRRCPKCWYSMEGAVERKGGDGIVKFTCPECGLAMDSGQRLLRTRRRWRRALLASFIFLLGYGSLRTPEVGRYGWVAAVPTTVLVTTVSPDDFLPTTYWLAIPTDPLADEIRRRHDRGEVFHWQTDLLALRIRRALKKTGWALELESYDISDLTYRPITETYIADIVQAYIRFDDWAVNGGNAASLFVAPGRFIVIASPQTHEQVADILIKLRGETPQEIGTP